MIYDRDDLRRWSRPAEILTSEEAGRLDEWLELYESQLIAIDAAVPLPCPAHRIGARRAAEAAWAFDRQTASRHNAERRPSLTRVLRQADEVDEFEYRDRHTKLALEEIESARTFARVAAGASEVNVLPFNAKKRRKTG